MNVGWALAGLSRVHWYDIEAEKVRNALPEDTLRKIEKVLGVDFEIDFDTLIIFGVEKAPCLQSKS